MKFLSEEIDLTDLKSIDSRINEVNEVVGVWEFHISNCDVPLKIKVVKLSPPTKGNYMGVANLSVGGYRSLTPRNSVREAIRDALNGFFVYWKDNQESIEVVED